MLSPEKSPSEPDLSTCAGEGIRSQATSNLRAKRKRLQPTWSVEITELRDEMKELFNTSALQHEAQMNKLFPILANIQQANSKIDSTITFLAEENRDLKSKIKHLEDELKIKNDQMVLLEDRLEDTLRTSNNKTIEIKNVPVDDKESQEGLITMVENLSRNLNINVSSANICDIYKTKGKSEKKSIIVEFSSTLIKEKILKCSKSHNLQNRTNKLSAKHLGFKQNTDSPIYVSEHLTLKASRLYFLARDLKKSKGYKYCWTSFGKVFVRKEENSPRIWIKTECQVQHLMNE